MASHGVQSQEVTVRHRTNLILCIVLALTSGHCVAGYPDQVSPQGAAFSLMVAIGAGDVAAARETYRGNEAHVLALIEASERLSSARAGLVDAAAKAYGRPVAAAAGGFDSEANIGGMPLSWYVASMPVVVEGDSASLTTTQPHLLIRLERRDERWVVTSMSPLELAVPAYNAYAKVLARMTKQIQQGVYKEGYRMVATLAAEMQNELERTLNEELNPDVIEPVLR